MEPSDQRRNLKAGMRGLLEWRLRPCLPRVCKTHRFGPADQRNGEAVLGGRSGVGRGEKAVARGSEIEKRAELA